MHPPSGNIDVALVRSPNDAIVGALVARNTLSGIDTFIGTGETEGLPVSPLHFFLYSFFR